MTLRRLAVVSTLLLAPAAAGAANPGCTPCAGLFLNDPYAALEPLAAAPRLQEDAVLYLAWEAVLDGTATPAAAHALAGAGATPWIRLRFRTAAPLLANVDALERELEAVAALASSRPERIRYEVAWSPDGAEATPPSAREYAYLVKRAAVAISGVDPDARVFAGPLPADSAWLGELYGEETAAYLDGVTFAPTAPEGLHEAIATVVAADPGSEAILAGAPMPSPRGALLADAARNSAAGLAATLFADPAFAAGDLVPLKLLADEFRGDLSLDRSTAPTGGTAAWSFVRGADLGLRVIAAAPQAASEVTLRFPDPQLKNPVRVLAEPRSEVALASARRTADALLVPIADPAPVEVLRVERASIEELEGVAEEVTVATDRQMPVEEILRRLQAFEDGQSRRLRHYQAVNATTLRFQAASGVQAVEATFEGEVFVRQGEPFDWAWQNFYLNGVKWRGKSIPEIPLIQPEKAAAMPLEILFSKEYRYELAGSEVIDGRDCWVVDFEPSVPADGKGLYRGRVWVDREVYSRVRTRAVQLGLEGEVLSNEETMEYTPVDAAGAPAAWSPASFVLPLRTVGQQLLSAFNTAVVVEKEVRLTGVVINGPEFDARREAVLASEATMVRDTDEGLRYLVPDEQGGRVVKEGYDTGKLFILGGVFYDDSLDYPLPLAGVNYIDLAFRGPERQLNAFFGGVLGIVNYADPRFLGSKIDLGVDVFGFAIKTSDQLYRNEIEQPGEEVRERPARVTFNLGFPIGSFVKISTDYQLAWSQYFRADDTADDFVLPKDNLTQRLGLGIQFARSGYRLNLRGAWHDRSDWEFWGLPGNPEFDTRQKDYLTWEASASKNWYFSKFRKLGLEVNWAGGEDLDRFSKYQFGFFGGNRVHGYQIGKVRAEEALAAHLTYGFEIGNLLRLDAVGDAAWATDEVSGLDRELLAGVGLQGVFMGPWETLISLDVGTPVAGPDDGVAVYLVFLKLFD